MTIDDVPGVTFALAVGMGAIHMASPAITPLSYTALAPWMHAGVDHLLNNLLVFTLLGAWVERRLGWAKFLFVSMVMAYLALYLPIVFGYGELSRGASGLTMALTGYAILALLVTFTEQLETLDVGTGEGLFSFGILLVLVYLTVDAWQTVQRFVGVEPRPDGVAVSAHLTGLVLGMVWFGWRMVRYGLTDA
ncbi:rhomboid family intramembrane serine protease [Salinirubellus salinus]|uniref:Rhomboid family intramembrane serine protease n=1 Tax=Salinirubellus salinus TaxID=1364945 RepID=A0A9E7R036_9EURY|nr:rhomboid family intramembrane serine protease [Salinirubellus salinus]UWM53098.1 rhomboid family intramembrane serine protease [Salinirubellus salinus]